MIVTNIPNLIVVCCFVIKVAVRSHSIILLNRARHLSPLIHLNSINERYSGLFTKLCITLNSCQNSAKKNAVFNYVTHSKNYEQTGSSSDQDGYQMNVNNLYNDHNINSQIIDDKQITGHNKQSSKEITQQILNRLREPRQKETLTDSNAEEINTKLLSLLDSLLHFINFKTIANYNNNLMVPPQIHQAFEETLPLLTNSERHSLSEILHYFDKMYDGEDETTSSSTRSRWTRSTPGDTTIASTPADSTYKITKAAAVTEAPSWWTPYSAIGTIPVTSQKKRAFHLNTNENNKQWLSMPSVTENPMSRNSLLPVNENDELLSTTTPFHFGLIETVPLLQQNIAHSLDQFQRKFYKTTFKKLTSISPPERRENGISFVESGLFLYLILTALSLSIDEKVRKDIDESLALVAADEDKIEMVAHVLDSLPVSNDDLKFRWSTRLIVNGTLDVPTEIAKAIQLRVNHVHGSETPEELADMLNRMVEDDSGGAMRNTFEEEELSDGSVRAVLMSTVYMRARWRASPTLLNGTRPFRDADGAPPRSTTMIRINDIMQYADLTDWDAEALEIQYSTPGLSLVLLVPRGRSLRALSERASNLNMYDVLSMMKPLRVAATLPIYTLRMTLLLPNKLQAMGMSRLVDTTSAKENLRLSHAIQRLMFWAEAGRNAFKDDGIEWDHPPALEVVVDRPYLFFVRWHNFTLMNGNFVL